MYVLFFLLSGFCKKDPLDSILTPARERGIQFDEESLQYLAQAAEHRLRHLFHSTLSAQTHRTTSSHARPAPLRGDKPLWSHTATSDPTAVLALLNKQNKEAEQAFRANRMDRLARQTQLAKEKAIEDSLPDNGMAGPSTPMKSDGGASPGSGGSGGGGGGGGGGTPVFGAVGEKKKKGSGKKKEVSADVAHKMSNMTALRQAGISTKQYSWMNMPNVSSPLAGKPGAKKRKGVKNEPEEGGASGGGQGGIAGDSPTGQTGGGPSGSSANGDSGERSRGASAGAAGSGTTELATSTHTRKRKRIKLTEPTRREIVVARENGLERRLPDERVLSIADVLFVLEKDGVGRGMGNGDDVVRRVWSLGEIGRRRERS